MAANVLAAAVGYQARISHVGPDGNPAFDGLAPATAYNPQSNQYLVVWEGDAVTDDESEIYGQLTNAGGNPVGSAFRISQVGADGDPAFDAFRPAVAYNPQTNEYLVIWHSNAGAGNQFEIYGQRVSATGIEVGPNDFRISDAGPDGRGAFDASRPDLAYNSATNEFLVVWYGDDTVDNEFEIYGQRITATGAEVGPNDFRISDAGPDGDPNYDSFKPEAAYNSQANEFLVVWYADDAVNDELEVYGQRLAASGAEVGANDFRISDAGPNGNPSFAAQRPSVAYSPQANEYLVVWDEDDNTPPLVAGENEIFGQRLAATGAEVGANDFRISDAGPDGDPRFDAVRPVVVAGQANEYMVAWYANETPRNQFEVYGQRLNTAGAAIGENDFPISKLSRPQGNAALDAQFPGLAYGGASNEYLAVWSEDGSYPLADDEFEIFGRRSAGGTGRETGPSSSTGGPKLTLRYRKRQKLAKKRKLIIYATSNQDAALRADARISRSRPSTAARRLRIRTIRRNVAAAHRYKLRFRVSKRVRRAAKRSLRRHKPFAVRLKIRVTNAAGLSTTVKAIVRARR
jgi:hypothetical protein